MDLRVLGKDHREAHAVDREAVAGDNLARERRRDAKAESTARRLALDELTYCFRGR
jgi:hypothetical protein